MSSSQHKEAQRQVQILPAPWQQAEKMAIRRPHFGNFGRRCLREAVWWDFN